MKRLLSIATLFLTVLILTNQLSSVLVTGYFYLNQEYFAKEKCENRYNEQSNCHGQCCLKKMQEEAEKSSHKTEKEISLTQINPVVFPSTISFSVLTQTLDIKHTPQFQHLFDSDIAISVFHPPRNI